MRSSKTILAMVLSLYLGLADGYLAIYGSNQSQPLQVLPYPAELFTQTDRTALDRGIPFNTEAELNKLLEDFTS